MLGQSADASVVTAGYEERKRAFLSGGDDIKHYAICPRLSLAARRCRRHPFFLCRAWHMRVAFYVLPLNRNGTAFSGVWHYMVRRLRQASQCLGRPLTLAESQRRARTTAAVRDGRVAPGRGHQPFLGTPLSACSCVTFLSPKTQEVGGVWASSLRHVADILLRRAGAAWTPSREPCPLPACACEAVILVGAACRRRVVQLTSAPSHMLSSSRRRGYDCTVGTPSGCRRLSDLIAKPMLFKGGACAGPGRPHPHIMLDQSKSETLHR